MLCRTPLIIKVWGKMLAMNKITSVDKVVFNLVCSRLTFNLYS